MTSSPPPDHRLIVDVTMTSEAWDELVPGAELWAQRILGETLIAAFAQAKIERGCALSLLFADDAAVRDLNRRFRGKDKPTNVLPFPAHMLPGGEEIERLGDIAFALETVRAEAAQEGKPFTDHLSHLLIHGILHLLGQDHETDEGARRMTEIEIDVMARLGLPDPYAERARQAGAA